MRFVGSNAYEDSSLSSARDTDAVHFGSALLDEISDDTQNPPVYYFLFEDKIAFPGNAFSTIFPSLIKTVPSTSK